MGMKVAEMMGEEQSVRTQTLFEHEKELPIANVQKHSKKCKRKNHKELVVVFSLLVTWTLWIFQVC